MAFAVVCKSCQARFLLNDDLLRRKVAGKVVTVRCRQCHATIEVDASDVDPKGLRENEAMVQAPPAPPPPKPMTYKAAPSPPRPAKSSTLMGIGGIGGPARPAAATELVALSPGLMNVTPSPPRPVVAPRGFPEPPPPPGAVEELSSGDWEISETPPLAKALPAPPAPAKPIIAVAAPAAAESVDDFIEELPPSLPPPDEEAPSSSGIPSLKALAHHEPQQAERPRSDDFFANMSAAMNGGMAPGAVNAAPTIDVSTLTTAPAEAEEPPNIDFSALDAPLTGSKTMPLFALGSSETTPAAAARPAPARAAQVRPQPGASVDGSLSPAALDRPTPESGAAESVRERKNVVAPATKSVPPAPAGQRRSGLAAPVLLVLAAAAGFLIWKRSASTPSETIAHEQQPAPRVSEPARPAAPVAAPEPTAPAAIASTAAAPAPTEADDVTFETTPIKQTQAAAAVPHEKPAQPATEPGTPQPKPAEPKAEPAAPIAKEEPKPTTPTPTPAGPTEPAGPFDRAAAAAALTAGAAQASGCKKEGDPSGVASVVITFAPSGRVTSANVSGPPFAGTPTGGCIAAALRKAHVPPFEGDRVTVSKTIVIQ
jgi:predicted Zn finger-like uncharacterized protein